MTPTLIRFAFVLLLANLGCGAAAAKRASTAPAGIMVAANGGTATAASPQLREQLVIEAWLTLEVEDVAAAAAALRAEVERAGGRVINEQVGGGATSWSGEMSMRLPPDAVEPFFALAAKQGTIESKRVQASDVSKQLFDQDLALANLGQTMERLQQLLARPGLEMKDVLALETEMTRLRGEIERIKGEQRWLKDRVAYATISVQLRRKAGAVLGPSAKFFPGGRFATLSLLEPGGRKRTRMGGGLTILFPQKEPNNPVRGGFQIDAFQGPAGEEAAFMATISVATYSDFLGRGRRRFINPYLGIRLGYAHMDGSAFTFSGTAGIELFKHEYFMIDASVDLAGFVSNEFEGAVIGGAGAVFAF